MTAGAACTAPVSPPTIAGGNSIDFSCESLLQNAQQTQTPLLVPIYVSASGSPPTFTLKGFAEFVVTGYNLPDPDGDGSYRYAADWLMSATAARAARPASTVTSSRAWSGRPQASTAQTLACPCSS